MKTLKGEVRKEDSKYSRLEIVAFAIETKRYGYQGRGEEKKGKEAYLTKREEKELKREEGCLD